MLFGGFFMPLLLRAILTFSSRISRAQKHSDIGLLQAQIVTSLCAISKLSALTFSKPISPGSDRTWRTPASWFRLPRVIAELAEAWQRTAWPRPNASVFARCNSTSWLRLTKLRYGFGKVWDSKPSGRFRPAFATPGVDSSTFT